MLENAGANRAGFRVEPSAAVFPDMIVLMLGDSTAPLPIAMQRGPIALSC